jgi:hypothetical protein
MGNKLLMLLRPYTTASSNFNERQMLNLSAIAPFKPLNQQCAIHSLFLSINCLKSITNLQ